MPEGLPESVASVTTAITRRADVHVEQLDDARNKATGRTDETRFLTMFEDFAADILDRYHPPITQGRDKFVFDHLYRKVGTAEGEDERRAVVAALLAAEVEARGPLRLTHQQNIRLATIFRTLGRALSKDRLPLHAALAYERAASLFLQVGEHAARDRCLLAQARAMNRARQYGLRKALGAVSDAVCGYGYLPYRLMGWVLVQLLGFSTALGFLVDTPFVTNAYMCFMNYLNPVGFGDTKDMPQSAWLLFVIEGYAGVVSLSVFFALLVRRWFRI